MNVAATPAGLTVVGLGGHDDQGQIDCNGGQVVGQDYAVTCRAMLSSGGILDVKFTVKCVAE